MKQQIIVFISILSLLLPLSLRSQVNELSAFNSIKAKGNVEVIVRYSDQFSYSVDNPDMNKITLKVKDNCLIVKRKGGIKESRKIFIVNGNSISRVSTSSGARVTLDSLTTTDTILLAALTGSEIRAKVHNSHVTGKASGGSFILLSGATKRLLVTCRQGSTIRANELNCNKAYLIVTLGSFIAVNASPAVSGKVTTGSELKIYGGSSPKDVVLHTGGRITLANE